MSDIKNDFVRYISTKGKNLLIISEGELSMSESKYYNPNTEAIILRKIQYLSPLKFQDIAECCDVEIKVLHDILNGISPEQSTRKMLLALISFLYLFQKRLKGYTAKEIVYCWGDFKHDDKIHKQFLRQAHAKVEFIRNIGLYER